MARFGDERVTELNALEVSRAGGPRWRKRYATAPTRRWGAAVNWQWIERNVAADVPNRRTRGSSSSRSRPGRRLRLWRSSSGPVGPAGDLQRRGLWRRVERRRPGAGRLHGAVFVRQGSAEALREDAAIATPDSTAGEGARRAPRAPTPGGHPLPSVRGRADQHRQLPHARVDSSAEGRWHRAPAHLRRAAHVRDVEPRRGMCIFTLSRRMGTSVQMIDSTYGHLAHDAEDQDRRPVRRRRRDARERAWARCGRDLGEPIDATSPRTRNPARCRASGGARPRGFEPLTFGSVDRMKGGRDRRCTATRGQVRCNLRCNDR
jgi:hypothetical protein